MLQHTKAYVLQIAAYRKEKRVHVHEGSLLQPSWKQVMNVPCVGYYAQRI